MNQSKFDSLPPEIRDVLEDMTGDNLVAKFGDWWDAWDARGKNDAIERGNEIIEIDTETRNAWREQLHCAASISFQGWCHCRPCDAP